MTALVPAIAGALLVAGLIGLTLGLRKTPPPAPAPGPTGAPRLGRLAAVTPRTRMLLAGGNRTERTLRAASGSVACTARTRAPTTRPPQAPRPCCQPSGTVHA